MGLGRFLRNNLKGIAKTAISMNPIGKMILDTTGILDQAQSDHPLIQNAKSALQELQAGVSRGEIPHEDLGRIKLAEIALKEAEIEASVQAHEENAEIYQEELKQGGEYTAQTRPFTVRTFAVNMTIMLHVLLVVNIWTFYNWTLANPKLDVTKFTPFLGDVLMYVLLAQLGVIATYFGMRSWDKIKSMVPKGGILGMFGK